MTLEKIIETMSKTFWNMDFNREEVVEAVRNIEPYLVAQREMLGFDCCFVWYKVGKAQEWSYDERICEETRTFECIHFDILNDREAPPNMVSIYYMEGLEFRSDKRRVTARDLIHDIDLGDWYEYMPRKK